MSARQVIVATTVGLAAVALVGAGCGSGSSDGTTSADTAGTVTTDTSTAKTQQTSGLRDKRYCEVILVTQDKNDLTQAVYSTQGLNDCPEDQWKALDADKLAEENSVDSASLNGPRHWTLDTIEAEPQYSSTKTFGGIEMDQRAQIQQSVKDAKAKDKDPYKETEVERNTTWTYDKGKMIYEIATDDGKTYVMQSYSQIDDPNLTIEDLPTIGSRLELPDGWKYRARTIEEDLDLTASGIAYLIQDSLGNSYQRQ
jgi:hypothetical protein